MQWKVQKLKQKNTREKFKDKIKKLINTEAKDLWGSFKDWVLETYKKFVEKENERASKEAHAGGMKKCKKQ